jgi:hypothetical protein
MNTLRRRAATATAALAVAAATAAVSGSSPAHADAVYRVYNTGGIGLTIRSAPTPTSGRIGGLPEGASVSIHCQTTGANVNGSTIWDQLTAGGYVSDWYVNTPNVGSFSPGLPQCGQNTPPPTTPPPTTAPTAGPAASPLVARYNRAAAAQWAVAHAYDRPTYTEDCTNFVSNAMSKGGRLAQQSWWWFQFAYPKELHSYSWTVAKSFADEMYQHGYVTRRDIDMTQRVVPGVQVGDLILYDQGDGAGLNHLAIVVTVTANGTPLIAQHTEPRSERIWNRTWELSNKKAGWHAMLLHVRTDG